jgi:type VI secretion system protein ImpA
MTGGRPLDIGALLAPISDARPAGADLRYAPALEKGRLPLYDEIKATRRMADDKFQGRSTLDDSTVKLTAEERIAAALGDWLTVESLAVDALTTRSKDLQLAVWLLEAETYINGFSGAGSVFELIRRLLETYWETMYPAIEEDDEPLALRVGALDWIDDKLPGILKGLPLSSGSLRYSLADYERGQKATDEKSKAALAGEGRPSPEQFLQVMSASSPEHLEALAGRIEACLHQVRQLEQVTDERLVEKAVNGSGRPAPLVSFGEVRKVLEDSQFQVGRALRSKGGPSDLRPPASASTELPGVSSGATDDIWARALQLVMSGQLEGLHLAQNHIQSATSGRERFLRQLHLSELCIRAGMHVFAYPILDELGQIIDKRDLVTWEDVDVLRRTWTALALVCKALARLRPESVAREGVAEQRLTALNQADTAA